jgi:hypothetical protein
MQTIKWLKMEMLGIALIYLSCSPAYSRDSFTPLFIVKGIVEEHLLDASGKILRTDRFPFTVSADTSGRWQMVLQTYFPQWSLTSTNHISYNGTDIFSVLYSDKILDRDLKPANNLPLENHEHPAQVYRGPFPVDFSSRVGFLWIAFVGGEFVNQNTIQPPDLLAANARTDPEAWTTDFQYKLLTASPNPLIATGTFLLDKAKIASDLMGYPEMDEPTDSKAMLQRVKRLKAAKNDELLRSTYSLQETELIGDVRIPKKFSATHSYDPGSVQGPSSRIEWYGQVTNIIAHPAPTQLLPPIIGRINVEDWRFRLRTRTLFRNDIWYKLDQTGWVLSTNDSRIQGASSPHLLQRKFIGSQKSQHLFILTIFGLLIAMAAYFLARKIWNK